MTATKKMRAIALDRFGGVETLALRDLPVPEVAADEVLVRVIAAGVGEWDPFEREGGYARLLGLQPHFPYVLGSEGAGVVEAVGRAVRGVKKDDRVLAIGFLNPSGGFYAEYVAVKAGMVANIPSDLTAEAAAALGGVGITALRGLEDVLALEAAQAIMIFGASGGIGHVAIQLARRMGARVLAVASGDDGVRLARQLGAQEVLDGRADVDLAAAARRFAPAGLDAALLTAGGPQADRALQAIRPGGHVAYPRGIDPEPGERPGVKVTRFDGDPDPAILARLIQRVSAGPFTVHVARSFPLARAADAHRALDEHYLGKLVLRVGPAGGLPVP
jgi:NADPH:quinone reductase